MKIQANELQDVASHAMRNASAVGSSVKVQSMHHSPCMTLLMNGFALLDSAVPASHRSCKYPLLPAMCQVACGTAWVGQHLQAPESLLG